MSDHCKKKNDKNHVNLKAHEVIAILIETTMHLKNDADESTTKQYCYKSRLQSMTMLILFCASCGANISRLSAFFLICFIIHILQSCIELRSF